MAIASLKTKMVATVSLMMAGLTGLLVWFAFGYFEKHLKTAISQQQFALVSAVAEEIDGKIDLARAVLKSLASRVPSDLGRHPAEAQRFLQDHDDSRLIFENGLALFAPDGHLVAVNPWQDDIVGRSFAFRDYFQQPLHTRQAFLSAPFRSTQQSGHPIIMFTEPILDPQGTVTAILGGSLDLLEDNFLGRLLSIKVGHGGNFYLFDSHKTMIIHPDPKRILQTGVPIAAGDLVDLVLNGFEGSAASSNLDGEAVLCSFKRLGSTGWILAASFPTREVFAPIEEAKGYFALLLLILVSLSVVVVWFLMNTLTAPLSRFSAHVRQLTGSTPRPFPVAAHRHDEVGTLAHAFNHLLAEMERQNRALADQYRFLQILLETIPNPIFYKDTDCRYLGCNGAFEAYIGMDRSVLIGRSVFDLYEVALAEVYDRADRALLQAQEVQVYEAEVRYADGSLHDVIFYKGVFRNADGSLGGILGTLVDITARKQAEQALRQSEADLIRALAEAEHSRHRVDAILKSVADGLIVVDDDGNIQLANPVAENLLGFVAAEVLGLPILTVLTEQRLGQPLNPILAAPETPSPPFFVEETRQGENEPRILQIRPAPMQNQQGDPIGVILTLQDVTHEKHLDRMKNEFISTAAHELRTPLAAIMGFSEILSDPELDVRLSAEEEREFLQVIHEKALALDKIVDDLLDISRIEAGRGLTYIREPTDPFALMTKTVSYFRTRSPRHRFVIEEPGGSPHPSLMLDRDKFIQVLENLLSNAVKYSPQGGLIRLGGTLHGDTFSLVVADEGIGMTPAQVGRMFDKFYRADASDTAVGGLGLGMSIIKTIVEGHGGRVRVQSTLGQGTAVFVDLPL